LPPGLMKEDKYPYGLAKQGKIPGGWLNKCPEPGINSDSFFYDFDLAMEKTMLALAPTENAKAELSSKYADERLAELVVKMEEGDRESVYRLVEEYESQMSKTKQFIEAAKNKGDYSPEVDKVSAESLLVHEIILEEAIDESDSLLSYGEVVIGELVDSYSEARDEAVARLEEEAPGKAAEVHLQVARRKLEKVRDKSEFEYRVVDGKIEKVYEEFEQEEVVEIGSLVGDYLETIDKVDILIDESESNGEEINGVGELVESEETYEDIVTLVEIYSVVGELDKEEVSMAVEASFELKEKVSEKVQEQKQRKEEEKLQKQEEKGEKEVEKEEKQEEKETNSNKEESSTKAKENKETKAQGKGKGLTGSAILDWFSGLFN